MCSYTVSDSKTIVQFAENLLISLPFHEINSPVWKLVNQFKEQDIEMSTNESYSHVN